MFAPAPQTKLSLQQSVQYSFTPTSATCIPLEEQQSALMKAHNSAKSEILYNPININLNNLRNAMFNFDYGRSDISIDDIGCVINSFKHWVKENVVLVLHDPTTNIIRFSKASKRGNYVYKKKITERIDNMCAQLEESNVRDLFVRQINRKFYTNAIFITLTWDSTKFSNRFDSWNNFLKYEYNNFITKLRKDNRLGKSWVYRVVESTQKGYPHIHLVVLFENKKEVFKKHSKSAGCDIWRLKKKNIIDDCWHSFTDVQGISNLEKLSTYISKDLTKQINMKTPQGEISLAMNWLFKKRSYAISNNFDLIRISIIQTDPLREQIEEAVKKGWKLLGFAKVTKFEGAHPPDTFSIPANRGNIYELSSHISSPSEYFELLFRNKTGLEMEM